MTVQQVSGNSTVQQTILWLVRLLMKLLLRVDAANPERIPAQGAVIVIINHISILDPVLVLGGLPRMAIPMGKQEAFRWFLMGPIFKLYGAIPVRRGEADLQAIKAALRVLNDGGLVVLAPEGTRSPTGDLQSGKNGAAMIALRSQAVIVPLGVTGTTQVWSHWLKLRRAPIRLAVGEPFRLRALPSGRMAQRSETAAMTREMMYRLAAQLPEKNRGVYKDLEQASQAHLVWIESDSETIQQPG